MRKKLEINVNYILWKKILIFPFNIIFKKKNKIIKIIISNSVNIMSYMFFECSSLTS